MGFKFFELGNYAAAAWNTIPRDRADLAHISDSYFNAFSRAFGDNVTKGRLLQLHGFAQQKRRSMAGQTADLILSATIKQPTLHVQQIATCARSLLPNSVRIYPEDVNELGGTQNMNAAAMRSRGHKGFVHVEMSKPLRNRLRKEKSLLRRFDHCLTQGML